MVTVFIINLNNLNQSKKALASASQSAPPQIVITQLPPATVSTAKSVSPSPASPVSSSSTPTPASVSPTSKSCRPEIGPIYVLSPQENEIIAKPSVCIKVSYPPEFCSVSWSYSLNNSAWSDPTSSDICLYNLPPGNQQLQLKVGNGGSSEPVIINRNFIIAGATPSPSVSPIASPSASLTP